MKKAILTLLLAAATGAWAQQQAVDPDGNKVQRLTFDRENVTVEYTTGASTSQVSEVTVTRQAADSSTVGIITVEPVEADAETMLFDMSGRRVQTIERPGIYIEKRGSRVRKIVKVK